MTQRSTIRRIRAAFLAHGLTRSIRVLEQLLLVPLLLAGWGAERFGEWITLNSLSALTAVATFGIGHAASADIILRHAEGDTKGAAGSFTTAMALLAAVTVAGMAGLWGLIQFFDVSWLAASSSLGDAEAARVLLLLGLTVLLAFWVDPLVGVLSASVGAGLPNLVTSITKAVEIGTIALAIRFGATPTMIAAILLGSVAVNIVVDLALVAWFAPWMAIHPSLLSPAPIRRGWKVSLSFYFVFLCFGIIGVHGPRLIVSHEFGAAAVTLFTVLTTYTRTARSLAGMVIQSVQAEIGRVAAARVPSMLRDLIAAALGSALGTALLLLAAANLAAPWLIPLWTHGQAPLRWDLLIALSVVALVGSVFDTLMNAAAALHRLTLLALAYSGGLAVGLALGWLLLPALGISAIAAVTMLLPEVLGVWAGLRTMRNILGGTGVNLRALSLRPWRFLAPPPAEAEPPQ